MCKHILVTEADPVDVLVQELLKEEQLLYRRITNKNLKQGLKNGRAVFKRDGACNRYHAFCMLWPTQDEYWYELGTLWVHPENRGNGFSKEVFKMCLERLPRGAGAFLITRQIGVLELARSVGWQLERTNWTNSGFWQRIAEPWDRPVKSGGILMFWIP